MLSGQPSGQEAGMKFHPATSALLMAHVAQWQAQMPRVSNCLPDSICCSGAPSQTGPNPLPRLAPSWPCVPWDRTHRKSPTPPQSHACPSRAAVTKLGKQNERPTCCVARTWLEKCRGQKRPQFHEQFSFLRTPGLQQQDKDLSAALGCPLNAHF